MFVKILDNILEINNNVINYKYGGLNIEKLFNATPINKNLAVAFFDGEIPKDKSSYIKEITKEEFEELIKSKIIENHKTEEEILNEENEKLKKQNIDLENQILILENEKTGGIL